LPWHPISVGCALIIRLVIQTIRLEPSGAVWSRLEPSGAIWSRLDRRGTQREQARSDGHTRGPEFVGRRFGDGEGSSSSMALGPARTPGGGCGHYCEPLATRSSRWAERTGPAAPGRPGPKGALGNGADGPPAARHLRPTAAADEPGGSQVSRAYVLCTAGKEDQELLGYVQRARSEPGRRFVELAAGHSAHVTAPGELADVLAQLVRPG
jgi:hypothetical protein